MPVLAHRPLVVGDVVEVDGSPRAVLAVPVTSVPAHVLPRIRSPSVAGIGEDRRDDIARRDLDAADRTGSVESSPSLCSVLSTSMNSAPSPYLKVTRRQSIQRGTSTTSSCSTFTHSIVPMPSGNSNSSGSENGSVV